MNTNRVSIANRVSQGKGLILMLVVMFGMFATDLSAQDYTLSLKQRRMGDQIGVEVWVKKNSSTADTISQMTIPVTYNTSFLQPADAAGYSIGTTDSVDANIEQSTGALPYRTITSSFDNLNSYKSVSVGGIDNTTLFINVMNIGMSGATFPFTGGFDVEDEGLGSFMGIMRFDIINHANISVSDLSGINFNTDNALNVLLAFDNDGTNITSDISTNAPGDFAIKGITILNPQGPNEAVNRNKNYSSMDVAGYPIYFERSGLITPSATKRYGTATELAYVVSYNTENSTDTSSTSWNEIMRVGEYRGTIASQGANTANYSNGEVVSSNGATTGFWLTQGDGSQLPIGAGDGYGGVLRAMWDDDPFFAPRSEEARLMIQHLRETGTTNALSTRANDTAFAISHDAFILSRLFFYQFDGTDDFLKSDDDYTNATQLTVEAWVNVNTIGSTTLTLEPGIVAQSNGPAGIAEEGAWILYLKDGKYPAFRAREFFGGVGRGENDGDYIATVVSPDALTAVSDVKPISDAHSLNWHHIAATVANNVVSIYVDGELKSQTANKNKTDIRMPISEAPIWIGVNPNGTVTSDDYLNAGIKEVKIWRTALTQGEIRQFMPGVPTPSTWAGTDPRSSLQFYWNLAGVSNDLASSLLGNQEGVNGISYYENINVPLSETVISEERYPYRPDRAHVRITSPTDVSGVNNRSGQTYAVRYASHGMGANASAGSDLVLKYSRDGGSTWDFAIDENGVLLDDIDVEDASDDWEPYRSTAVIGAYNDLQAVTPGDSNYSKSVRLRITGTSANNQSDISFETGDFTLAPYMAMRNTGENTIIVIEDKKEMNLLGGVALFEAWIRPYRFPTTTEGFFPIINKTDTLNSVGHYSLRLLSSGQLQFKVWDKSNNEYTATSSTFQKIEEPKSGSNDSVWTHVAAYVNLGNGTNTGSVKLYIDGNVQTGDTLAADNITTSVIDVNDQNAFDAYIGFEDRADIVVVDPITLVTTTTIVNKSFIGELKGLRYWNGLPGGVTDAGNELTYFIQGVQGVKASELLSDYRDNLVVSFDLDGSSVVADDMEYNGIYSVINGAVDSINAKIIVNNGLDFVGLKPLVKVVEPVERSSYTQDNEAMTVRWVGFGYDRGEFMTGDAVTSDYADLEWSSLGGGDNSTYNFVSSDNDNAGFADSWTLPLTTTYKFNGTNPPHNQFAGSLDVSKTKVSGAAQANMDPAKFNAIFRLKGRATINSATPIEFANINSLRGVGPLFTITAPSNFTVRVMLQGYHAGAVNAFTGVVGNEFDLNGVRISLYTDQGGKPTTQIASQVASADYKDKAPLAGGIRGIDGSEFGNLRFVFEDIVDSTYFVVVEHENHMPVMSRYAAPFAFSGDDISTWGIESGWDFQSWEGDSAEVITSTNAVTAPFPTVGDDYTAHGYHESSSAVPTSYNSTGLRFSDGGVLNTKVSGLSAMVAGDVVRDGLVDAADRTQVRLEANSSTPTADVTGDGLINASDRTIIDNNDGAAWSLGDVFDRATFYTTTTSIQFDDASTGKNNVINTNSVEISRAINEMDNSVFDNKNKFRKLAAKTKVASKMLADTDPYVDLTTDVRIDEVEGLIYLDVFIQNVGRELALGNCTFGFKYDNNKLRYMDMSGREENIWDNNSEIGYFKMYSAPSAITANPISNVRTIEIDYNNSKPAGIQFVGSKVAYEKTKIATLVFSIKDVNVANTYDFAWFKSTVLYDIDANIIKFSKDGIDSEGITTTAVITSPNGGESWKVGKSYFVSWTRPSEDSDVAIQLSTDNGLTWLEINENMIDIMNTNFEYFVENFHSTECLVRLVDVNGNEIDASDNVFSIEPPAYFITKPTSKDAILIAGETASIQWLANEPTDVYFSFSANGKDDWVTITDVVNTASGAIEWEVPSNVNTKNAVIKMIQANSNDRRLSASEPFRVLAGSLDFTSPKQGDVITYTQNPLADVSWIMNNVSRYDLYFSGDAGNNWELVRANVNAIKGHYAWDIAKYMSQQAILKAIYRGDHALEYDRTGIFEVIGSGNSVESSQVGTFTVGKAYPNPFNSSSTIEFSIPEMQNVSVIVYNAAGMMVADLGTSLKVAGPHSLSLDADELAQGVYFVQITAGNEIKTVEVVVEK